MSKYRTLSLEEFFMALDLDEHDGAIYQETSSDEGVFDGNGQWHWHSSDMLYPIGCIATRP